MPSRLLFALLIAVAPLAAPSAAFARAFPALTEPDPHVVYQNYQDALSQATDFEALEKLLSSRKRAYISQRTTGADARERGRMLGLLRDQFLVRGGRLMHDDVEDERAILVYDGQIILPDKRIVQATVGVILIKEDGEWRVDHQRASYRDKGAADAAAPPPEKRVEF